MQNVIERVLNVLIFLLESPRPVTADDIRQTVPGYSTDSDEAFHRMFERDKNVLRDLGVPLELVALDAWEVDFGYSVDPDQYAIGDPGLTDEEKAALSLAARMVRLGGSFAGVDGLHKLGGIERGSGVESFGADLGDEGEALGKLFEAVSQRRPVGFTYRGNQRSINPYGVAYRRGHWYLIGAVDGDERVYRVDRMSGVDVGSPGAFKRPKGFSAKDFLQSHPWESGGEDQVEATVRFDSDVAWWASRTLGIDHREGPLEVSVPMSNQDAFIGWILSFGPSAEVLAPESLREAILQRVGASLLGVNL
ncbi:MAG TPA: WYL domain-containing protein [Acidimicrobiia bacterium]